MAPYRTAPDRRSPRARAPFRAVGALLLALGILGCDGEPSSAQEAGGDAVVPSDRSTVVERADRPGRRATAPGP